MKQRKVDSFSAAIGSQNPERSYAIHNEAVLWSVPCFLRVNRGTSMRIAFTTGISLVATNW